MKQHLHKSLRLAATLLVALSASSVWGSYPIDITFSAEGESTNVQSVTVTNLTQTAISPVTLSGTDILRLVDPDDPDAIEGTEELKVVTQPILTPNPSMGDGTLIFDAKSDGPVRVSVYTAGGMLLDAATLNVTKGRNTALIPSQAPGIYSKCRGSGRKVQYPLDMRRQQILLWHCARRCPAVGRVGFAYKEI